MIQQTGHTRTHNCPTAVREHPEITSQPDHDRSILYYLGPDEAPELENDRTMSASRPIRFTINLVPRQK